MLSAVKSVPDSQTPVDINFDLLIKNIAELNIIAGEGIAQIKRSVGGAQFHVSSFFSGFVT